MAITKENVKRILDLHISNPDMIYVDIVDAVGVDFKAVCRVIDAYHAIKEDDKVYLRNNNRSRQLFLDICEITGLPVPEFKTKKKAEPAPEPVQEEPKQEPQRDILAEIRKKMDYHRTRYWILQELINDLEHDETVRRHHDAQ